MTKFAALLSRLLEEKGISVYTLSKTTGINRSYLQKMKNGIRLPMKQEAVVALAKAMMLSPLETMRFMDAYFQARMGDQKYRERRRVWNILSNFYTEEESQVCIRQNPQTTIHLKNHYAIVRGQMQVNHMVQALLEVEASRENGWIGLMTQPDFQYVNEALSMLDLTRHHTKVEQLICFDKGTVEGERSNLRLLRRLVPILFVQDNYVPYCTHEYVSSLFNDAALLPYIILTSGYAMHVSYDTAEAVVYDRPDLIALVRETFEKRKDQTKPIFKSMNTDTAEYLRYVTSLTDFDAYTPALLYQPTFSTFCPPDLLESMVQQFFRPPEDKDLAETVLTYFRNTNRHASHLIQNFTMEGLNQFMEEGYCIGLPRSILKGPLPPPLRLKVLGELIRRTGSGEVCGHLIRSRFFHIPPALRITAYTPTDILIRYYRKDGRIFLLHTKEASLVNAFRDFLNWLPDSHLVYGSEETLALLRACYHQYEKKFLAPQPVGRADVTDAASPDQFPPLSAEKKDQSLSAG